MCFAVEGDTIWSAVDAKPKRTRSLRRLRNVEADPRVSLLADHYEDGDWSQLWWVRADGIASIHRAAPHALALLTERYAQYAASPPAGPFVAVAVARWSGWAAS